MPSLLISFFLLCLFVPRALGWNGEGHMLVAEMAYLHLDPAAKSKCEALIAVPLSYSSSSSSNFVTAACWADDFKSQLGTATDHYIDLPFSLDGTSTNSFSPDPENVVKAIRDCITTLQNPASAQTNQATALRYLLHFVGDIQQPLHSSTAISSNSPNGDSGGNGFSLSGTWNNLHALWDAGGGYFSNSLSRPLSTSNQNYLSNKVVSIETIYPYTRNVGTLPDPMMWAQEGQGIAKTVSYVGITESATPSTSYLSTAQSTTKQRIAMGGHRLADLLNSLFAPIRLSSIPTIGGGFRMTWSALPGSSYTVQWKQRVTDSSWTSLTTVVAATNTASFAETPQQSQRIYRVVQ